MNISEDKLLYTIEIDTLLLSLLLSSITSTLVVLIQGTCWPSRRCDETRDKLARSSVGSFTVARVQSCSEANTVHSNCRCLDHWHSRHQV